MNRCSYQNNGGAYAQKYELILNDIKSKGIKVFHRKLKNGAAGLYDSDKCIITIGKEFRGTLDGCYYICHEFQHYLQSRYNKFPEFFNGFNEYSSENLAIVKLAEQDAAFGAKRTLKTYGIDYLPQELDPSKLDEMIRFWKKYYFGV